jgi:hypothetical protein
LATILRTDLSHEHVEPEDGRHFTFREVYKLIGCSMIEIVRIEDSENILLVDEEGLLKEGSRVNGMAVAMVGGGTIVGDVLVCRYSEVE